MAGPRAAWWRRHASLEPTQRRVIGVGLGLLLAYVIVRLALNPASIDDPQPPTGDRAGELADRLDPNTADANELAALPGIGRKRADALVARRQTVHEREPNAVAFQSPADLYFVSGFGHSMVEQLKPYLVFPATQKTSATGRTSP